LHDRVVVKRIDAEDKDRWRHHHSRLRQGKALAGRSRRRWPGRPRRAGKLIPIDVKVGDKVLFGKWSGTEVKIDGEDLLIMKESDILGVLEGEAAKKKPRHLPAHPEELHRAGCN
jgi:chaperonin GroES